MSITPFGGVSEAAANEVVLLPFNDLEVCERLIGEHASELGSLLVEPIIGDGYVPPVPEFLEGLRDLCDRHGMVLIFDEVVTLGIGRGGAQEYYGVTPDLAVAGKVVGGGFPLGVVGGRADLLAHADPTRGAPVPFGSAFGGHPLSVVAGLMQLQLLTEDVFQRLRDIGAKAHRYVADLATELRVPLTSTGVGHLFNLHWNERPIVTYADHCACRHDRLRELDLYLRGHGFAVFPGGRIHFNAALSDEDLEGFLATLRDGVIEVSENSEQPSPSL